MPIRPTTPDDIDLPTLFEFEGDLFMMLIDDERKAFFVALEEDDEPGTGATS